VDAKQGGNLLDRAAIAVDELGSGEGRARAVPPVVA
jgi:hypothetical protein